jgi:hypothetical protein
MAATLTLADSATTPTGATATVAGSSGAANTVYVRRADDAWNSAWLVGGNRVGDGEIPLTLTAGVWWAYLLSGTTPTPPQLFGVTDGLESVATRCREAVAARIALLNLSAVGQLPAVAGVYSQLTPDFSNVVFPAVILTSYGTQEAKGPGTNARDEVGYPVVCLVCHNAGKFRHDLLPGVERWRYWIDRAFDGQHLPGLAESVRTQVDPQTIVAPELLEDARVMSGLVVRCYTRVPRGLRV